MKRAKLRPNWVTRDEFNKAVSQVVFRKFVKYEPDWLYKGEGYIWTDTRGNMHLVYKDNINWKKQHLAVDAYKADDPEVAKEKQKKDQDGLGSQAIRNLKRYAKKYNEEIEIPEEKVFEWLNIQDFSEITVEQYMWYSLQHACTALTGVYSYDMNSCYPYFMQQELPYGDNLGPGEIESDEIGFSIEWGKHMNLVAVFDGFAQIRFKKKIYQSFVEYAKSGFEMKLRDKSKKPVYNALLGNMKYHNIFIRAAVITYATNFMKSLKDENTVMQTVDSLVSLKPRLDLELGQNLGQFKLEHENADLYFESNMIKCYRNEKESHAGISASAYANDLEIYIEPVYYLDEMGFIQKKQDVLTRISEGAQLWLENHN